MVNKKQNDIFKWLSGLWLSLARGFLGESGVRERIIVRNFSGKYNYSLEEGPVRGNKPNKKVANALVKVELKKNEKKITQGTGKW